MQHKISIGGDIGTLEWTPPPELQQKLDKAQPPVMAEVRKWMGRMIEGYVCALLDSQRTAHGIAWLEAKTIDLVSEALMLSSATDAKTSPSDRLN